MGVTGTRGRDREKEDTPETSSHSEAGLDEVYPRVVWTDY